MYTGKSLTTAISCAALIWVAQVQAVPMSLSTQPLYLGALVPPNVFFEVDDSGSMDWEILTVAYWHYNNYWTSTGENRRDDGLWTSYTSSSSEPCRNSDRDFTYYFTNTDQSYYQSSNACATYAITAEQNAQAITRDWRVRSSAFNVMWYNPDSSYQPWPGMSDASFTAARSNPQSGTPGYSLTKNLTGFVYEVWEDTHHFSGTYPKGPASATVDPGKGSVDLWDKHTRYTVGSSSVTVEVFQSNLPKSATCTLADAQGNPMYQTCFGTTRTSSTITDSATVAAIQQNIANWYQYYRKRAFVAKAAVAGVLSDKPGNYYGLNFINNTANLFVETRTDSNSDGIIDDFALHNAYMQDKLYKFYDPSNSNRWPAMGTPLRVGLKRTGDYFNGILSGKPSPIIHECQRNFAFLFTDGYWNGSTSPGVGDADSDSRSNTLADVAKYYYDRDLSPLPNNVSPIQGLDEATHQHMVTFGITFGVQGDLYDKVGRDGNPPPDGWPDKDASGNTTNWPSSNGNWGNPFATACSSGQCPERIDDVWHASFNGHGFFLSAKDPQEVILKLREAIGRLDEYNSSGSAVALNAGSLVAGNRLFQARFNSARWTGQLLMVPILYDAATNDVVAGEPKWDAALRLAGQSWDTGRNILTYTAKDDGTGTIVAGGVPFRWSSLNSKQQAQLSVNYRDPVYPVSDSNGSQRLEFLRGREFTTQFRKRSTPLGDIVNSAPALVDRPNNVFPSDWDDVTTTANESMPEDAVPYHTWRDSKLSRKRVVYVGANDGMVHGFDAGDWDSSKNDFGDGTGNEVLAYVPSMLYKKLARLTPAPDSDTLAVKYTDNHQYFVDGSLTFMDAFYGATWHTVLAGGLGGGGQGAFALDITDPSQFSETNAKKLLLWEFRDYDDPNTPQVDGDPDMGYAYGQPLNVIRLRAQGSANSISYGPWYAVFGNGYNNVERDDEDGDGDGIKACDDKTGPNPDPLPCTVSQTGNAVLYIVDLATGHLVRKIDTGVGIKNAATDKPNGLSTPAPVDLDGDFIADIIYAGDLYGNLWKFDVRSSDPTKWDVAFKDGSSKPLPLLKATAKDKNGAAQPITQRPAVRRKFEDQPSGVMIYFGTGKYFETSDNVVKDSAGGNIDATQTFYAVWDKDLDSTDPKYSAPPYNRGHLLSQQILKEIQQDSATWRSSTNNAISWHTSGGLPSSGSTYLGWKLDLVVNPSQNSDHQGERSVSDAVLRGDRVLFTTVIPDTNPCAFGGTGWLMQLEASDGSRTDYAGFDTNGDGLFSLGDYLTGGETVPGVGDVATSASGKKSAKGIISTPRVISAPEGTIDFGLSTTSVGGDLDKSRLNPGGEQGRESWQQVF